MSKADRSAEASPQARPDCRRAHCAAYQFPGLGKLDWICGLPAWTSMQRPQEGPGANNAGILTGIDPIDPLPVAVDEGQRPVMVTPDQRGVTFPTAKEDPVVGH